MVISALIAVQEEIVGESWSTSLTSPDRSERLDSDAALEQAAKWYLQRMQLRPDRGLDGVFCQATFVAALEASHLNAGAKRTMRATLGSANINGLTSRSGKAIAGDLGIRHATVSDHWAQAREAGLMESRRRFSNSSIQQLMWPGSSIFGPNSDASPLSWHIWTDAEFAWWESLHGGFPRVAPWADRRPPF